MYWKARYMRWIEEFVEEIRVAARSLLRSPVLSGSYF